MTRTFKRGDQVEWNSEAGRVRGRIVKKAVSDVNYKGYIHHASKEEPQYFIKRREEEEGKVKVALLARFVARGRRGAQEKEHVARRGVSPSGTVRADSSLRPE